MGSILPNPAISQPRSYLQKRYSRLVLVLLLLLLPLYSLLSHLVGAHRAPTDVLLEQVGYATHADSANADLSPAFLYVSSYSGSVTTLKFSAGKKLEPVALTEGCAASPSWLTVDAANSVLYCTDEGLSSATSDGSISSFRTIEDGSLLRLDQARTISGPVSLALYGKNNSGMAVAHYGGSALTNWDVTTPNAMESLETRLFKMHQPGPVPDRQTSPHPHAAVVDPKGKFVIVPDLGADVIRVYAIVPEDLTLVQRKSLFVTPGSGPRHVAFVDKGDQTFMYVVTELGNTIVGYEVTYRVGSLSFKEIWTSGIHGKKKDVPEGAAASEIIVSPDSNFLIVSSRNESSLEIPHFDPSNSTKIPSDPLMNFYIEPGTGHLHLVQEVPAGGRFPRQFSMNKAGDLVAVALQGDSRVVLIERNVTTGELGDFKAYAEIEGEPTTVIFNE